MATKNFNLAKLARNINIEDDGSIAFSSEVSAGTGGETIGSLTASMDSDQTTTINFTTTSTPVPIVQAYKEVPQVGISAKGQWNVNANATNYDFYDEKPYSSYASSTLTPSATGDGTFTNSNPIVVSYDLSNPTYDSKSFSHNSEDSTEAQGLEINNDGTKMYIFGRTGSTYQYSLSTAYDASTASYDSVSFDMSPYNNSGSRGLRFNNDGTKVYTCGNANDYVFQYSLSTAYDLSTASFTTEKYIGGQASTPQGVNFNNDGTRMYITNENGWIYQYPLSTPFLITSWGPSYDNTYTFNSSLSAKEMLFNDDGTKMYILHSGSTATIRTYSLSTAYDLSTVSYDNIEADLGFAIAAGSSFTLNNNGSKIYVNDPTAKTIKQYSVTESAFSASDVGKKVVGNSGSAIITSAAGAYTSVAAFADTSAISSWQLFSAQGKADGSGIELSGYVSGYNHSSLSYDNKSFSFTSEDTINSAIAFNATGTKMYMAGSANDRIYQYSLSTAYDISTLSYDNISLAQAPHSTGSQQEIAFKSDGSVMYISDNNQDSIDIWTVSSGNEYIINQYSYSSTKSLSAISSITDLRSVKFKSDGSKFFALCIDTNTVYEFTMSTAWDVTNAQHSSGNIYNFTSDISEGSARSIYVTPDGTELLITGNDQKKIDRFVLSTPWQINTASFTGDRFDYTPVIAPAGSGVISSMITNDTGTSIYFNTSTNDTVFQYNFASTLAVTSQYVPALTNSSTGQINSSTWVDINSMTADETKNDGDVFYAVSTDNRTSWAVAKASDGVRKIAKNNSGTWQYNNNAGTSTAVSTGFDLTNVTYDNKSFYFTLTGFMGGIEFKPDGTKLYVSDGSSTTNGIRQYNLSTAWDISTAVHYGTGNPQSIANHIRISDDGTQVYYLSQSNDYLYSDILSTPWDITTISYNAGTSKAKLLSISISGLTENSPQGFDFANNGSKLYMVGQSNQYIYEWSLSTPWDISTASIGASDWHNISSQDQFPEELVVSADGTKILVSGNGNDKVFEYVMSTAFDITTATYTNRSMGITDSGAAGDNPTGLALSADGMKLYYATSQEWVYQYSISGSVNVVGYGTSETWVNGTNNNEHATLQQALGAQSFNRMNKAQLDAIADANHFSQDSADTLDLMIAPYAASGTSPVSDGVTINYDAASKYRQAVPETDYRADFVGNNKLEFTSNISANFKVKVL